MDNIISNVLQGQPTVAMLTASPLILMKFTSWGSGKEMIRGSIIRKHQRSSFWLQTKSFTHLDSLQGTSIMISPTERQKDGSSLTSSRCSFITTRFEVKRDIKYYKIFSRRLVGAPCCMHQMARASAPWRYSPLHSDISETTPYRSWGTPQGPSSGLRTSAGWSRCPPSGDRRPSSSWERQPTRSMVQCQRRHGFKLNILGWYCEQTQPRTVGHCSGAWGSLCLLQKTQTEPAHSWQGEHQISAGQQCGGLSPGDGWFWSWWVE